MPRFWGDIINLADKLRSENKQGKTMADKKSELARAASEKLRDSLKAGFSQDHGVPSQKQGATPANKIRIEKALSEANSRFPIFRKS
jgi:hypothetical protein